MGNPSDQPTEEKRPNLKEIEQDETLKIREIDDPEDVDSLESDELHLHNEDGSHVMTISGRENIRNYLIMRKYQEHLQREDKMKFLRKEMRDSRKPKD